MDMTKCEWRVTTNHCNSYSRSHYMNCPNAYSTCMLLRLQKYSLQVFYKKGQHMYLTDTLSRAFLPEVNACNFSSNLEAVDHKEYLSVCEERLQQISHASADDPYCSSYDQSYYRDGQSRSQACQNACIHTLTTVTPLQFKMNWFSRASF